MNPRASVFAPQHRALTIGILLTVTAIACEGMAVSTIMPSVATDLGGLDAYGWAFSAFMLASLVGAIGAGQIADSGSASLPAWLGFTSFSAGLLIAGFAPAWPILLIGRVLQGFGAGNLGAIAWVAVARGYPEHLRPRLMALLSSAWIVPALVGPALAGQVAEHASWRWVFIGILPSMPIGALMLLPSLAGLPGASAAAAPLPGLPRASSAAAPLQVIAAAIRSARVFASVRLAAGVALVLLAATVQMLVLSVVLAALGALLAVPALRTLLPTGTFTGHTGMPAAVAVRGLLAFSFFASEALIPLGLTTQRGLSPSLVGLALTAGALAWVAGSWTQDRAEAWAAGSLTARSLRVAGGMVLIGLGIAAAALVILSTTLPVQLVVAAWALGGLGMGVSYPGTTLTALGLAPGGQEGQAASALQVAETVGIATGTGAAGALFDLATQLQHPMGDGLAWAFILAVAAVLIGIAPALRQAPGLSWSARLRAEF